MSVTSDLTREMIRAISISPYNIVPWHPFSFRFLTGERLQTNEHLIEDLAELREGTTIYNIDTTVSWPPTYPRTFAFDPFGDDNDASSSPRSFYHRNNARDDRQTSAVPLYLPVLQGGAMYPQLPFKFDPFWDESVSGSQQSCYESADARRQHSFCIGTNDIAPKPMVSSSPKKSLYMTFDPWGEESSMSSSPDSFYDFDDSRVKCTVTAQGKIWAPVPRVPMGAALAAFDVHAFAVTLPSPMSSLVNLPSTGEHDHSDENKLLIFTVLDEKSPDTKRLNIRGDQDRFIVFREDEDDVPAAELVPREANGNFAPCGTTTTRSEMQGKEPAAVFQEEEETPVAEHVPRDANGNLVFRQTGPMAKPVDIVTGMKDLLIIGRGEATNAMATRLFGGESSRRAAPDTPRVPATSLAAITSPALDMNYDNLYDAVVPAPLQPSAHPSPHQLSTPSFLQKY
ncbi:hypothetical protein FPV67DRAFT_1671645 [Lyophyllum atratum]|nr:hypothetical protein FPV67DRAFT_1671645 [Lyophyllum atratum]